MAHAPRDRRDPRDQPAPHDVAPRVLVTPSPLQVVAALVRRGPLVLVCQRPAHKHHGGLWELPGGKIEPGESPGAALARELDEELGLRLDALGPCVFVDHDAHDPRRPVSLSFLEVTCLGEPVLREHAALAWVELPAALRMPLAPADRRCLEHLARDADP